MTDQEGFDLLIKFMERRFFGREVTSHERAILAFAFNSGTEWQKGPPDKPSLPSLKFSEIVK